MTEKSTGNVSYKSTKDKIWAAYKEATDKLSEKGEVLMNADVIKQSEKKKEVLDSVDGNGVVSVDGLMLHLETFKTSTEEAHTKYTTLVEAIKLKEDELKELFGIEKSAFSLAALLDAHELQKEELRISKNEEIKQFEVRISEVRKDLMETQKEATVENRKKVSELDYEFERKRLQKTNELSDELEIKIRAHKEAVAKLYDELEATQKLFSEEMADFNKEKKDAQEQQTIIDLIPETVKSAEKAAVGKAAGIATKQFETEKKFYQLEKETVIAKLTADKENLTQLLVDAKEKETTLTTKLDSAYKELKELAGETVKGAQNSEMFDKMKSMMETSGKSK